MKGDGGERAVNLGHFFCLFEILYHRFLVTSSEYNYSPFIFKATELSCSRINKI